MNNSEDWIRSISEGMPEDLIRGMIDAAAYIDLNLGKHPQLEDERVEQLMKLVEGKIVNDVLEQLLTPFVVLAFDSEEQIELARRIAADIGTIYDAMSLYLSGKGV